MRRTSALRALIRETELAPRHLVAPLFVKEGVSEPIPIASMPGQSQHTLESLRKEAAEIASKGVIAFMLFGVPERKAPELEWNPTASRRGPSGCLDELGDDHG
jgi:porphobilinogen synthase